MTHYRRSAYFETLAIAKCVVQYILRFASSHPLSRKLSRKSRLHKQLMRDSFVEWEWEQSYLKMYWTTHFAVAELRQYIICRSERNKPLIFKYFRPVVYIKVIRQKGMGSETSSIKRCRPRVASGRGSKRIVCVELLSCWWLVTVSSTMITTSF